jgi:hypothetical protein
MSEDNCWYVSVQYYETDIAVVKCSTYRSATTECAGKVIRQLEITYSTTVEFNTAMALAILTEQRDFVGAGVGQSCRC